MSEFDTFRRQDMLILPEDDKTKRFLIFCGSTYYPDGGMADCVGSADSIPDALAKMAERRGGVMDWGHLFDTQDRKIIDINGEEWRDD